MRVRIHTFFASKWKTGDLKKKVSFRNWKLSSATEVSFSKSEVLSTGLQIAVWKDTLKLGSGKIFPGY